MVYNLNNHYCQFSVYKDNVLQPRAYFIPFRSAERLAQTDMMTERYASDMVTVLSGEWDFAYFKNVSMLNGSFDTDTLTFDKMKVPSCWQFTGYEPPYYVNTRYQFKPNPPEIPQDCSVGIYRRFITLTEVHDTYMLSFLGVAGALDVYCNGQYVGYSEGSHNTAEFELNEFLHEGDNELVAVVHKFSNGTYLECQDMFRNNGIFRDVLLYRTGENSLYDFELKTAYAGGKYSLTVLPSLKLTEACVLTVSLPELDLAKSVDVSPEGIDKIVFDSLDVQEWSDEIPQLYTVLLSLSKAGEPLEWVRRYVGFKHIDIKGNVFYFNNEPIKLLGVNHHDTDPKKGYVMSAADMERDVRLFKEYNCNCVRTSHYPPDSLFLDLCDFYGVYVVDEADIEAHGCQTELHRPGACSHNPQWQGHFWDRVYRMFERDKNHPSITMWSLGNESWGYRNQDYCYEQLKKRTDIPVHYENAVHTKRFAYDVISQMYPWQGKMKKVADGRGLPKKWYTKPYFLCEYCHAMGVGAGELETYVSDFLRADNMMGGCIWEFCDHAVYHEEGKYQYTYGGDHGEEKHDKNFCVDGLFYPDRTPHAGALQMKNCYRPVRAAYSNGSIVFKNLNYFAPVALTAKWEGYHENGLLETGAFELRMEPRQTQRCLIHLPKADTLVIRYFDGDTEVAGEQLTLARMAGKPSCASSGSVTADGRFLHFIGKNGKAFEAEIGVSLYRAPLDNDMYLCKVWDKMSLQSERLTLKKQEKNTAVYIISTDKIKHLAEVTIDFLPQPNGALTLRLTCQRAKPIPFTPRFGFTLKLPKTYDNVRYFGLGERQNLPDFKEHALLGEYACKVSKMRENYIKPQESGMRCDVRWAEVKDDSEAGLRVVCTDKPFIFSADRFTSQQCAQVMHREDLAEQDFTFLHLDAYQLGAGSGSCGPMPTKAYRKNNIKGCELTVTVMPL